MKKLYEQSPEMQLSGKCQLRHVKCTHHKGYLMEDFSMIKSGFYEISFCKSGDFLFRIGQKRHFITNGDILVIPPDIPHYFTSSDLVANYYDFITVWLEKSYISNLKSQLPALKESVFNIDTPHLLHTTNKLCNFEEEFETFYREYASYGELSETYACGASTCLLVKIINYALKYSNEFIEIESDQTNQIVRYLDQHFLKEIGVEDLARTFHMSKSSLNKFFQKQLNTTCHQCSRSKFLSKLLKTFDKTFREIFPVFISTKRREKPSAFFDNNFVNNAYFSEAASSSSSHLASSSSKAPISSRMTCLCLWSS